MQHTIDTPKYINNKLISLPHSINTPKYLKKVITETAFVQPILSSAGTMGGDSFAVQVSSTYSGSSFQLFDNNKSTYWDAGSRPNWWTFYNPIPLKVSKITMYSANAGWTDTSYKVEASNDNANWVLIKQDSIAQANTQVFEINSTGYYKYYRYTALAGGASSNAVHEVYITATQQVETWQECTKAEYENTSGSKRINQVNNVKTPKYLKKVITETAFVQPILSSAGTMGGDSFAVSGKVYQSSRAVWNMFDNNSSTFYDPSDSSWHDVIFTIYNPNPICVTKIQYVGIELYYQSKVQVQGSNDNSTWTNLGTYNLASGSIQTANITNAQFFKYYKFTGTGYSMVHEVKLTATEKTETWQTGTKDDYDLIK